MQEKPSVLIVDDELSIRESFNLILQDKYCVTLAATGETAAAEVASNKFDLVYLDIRMPGMNGLETLKKIRKLNPSQEVIMVTAVNDVQSASEAINIGARDYVVKPFDVEQILSITDRVIRGNRLLKESGRPGFVKNIPQLPGNSLAASNIKEFIHNEGPKGLNVLITGEEGTEKEWVAGLLHKNSARSSFVFEVIDIAQFPSYELEGAIFGKSQGESISLLKHKAGCLERAEGGTIFADNIHLLPVEIQARLLEYSGDVRIISATPINLSQTTFNISLIEKLSQAKTHIPSLRERAEDAVPIFLHFIGGTLEVTPRVADIVGAYPWPGNVEELSAFADQMGFVCQEKVNVEDLPFKLLTAEQNMTTLSFEDLWEDFEKKYVSMVLSETRQDKKAAARILGLGENVLESKLS
ncbi:MAG: response regulator [Candidatus Margulisiibacteriota bacterium]